MTQSSSNITVAAAIAVTPPRSNGGDTSTTSALRDPAYLRRAGTRRHGRVDHVDVEGEIDRLVADDFARLGHHVLGAAFGELLDEDDADAVCLGEIVVGRIIDRAADADLDDARLRAIRPDIYGFDSQHFAAVRKHEADAPLIRAFIAELKGQARTSAKAAIERKSETAIA
jgi:DNA-binding transcriptional LysR family regulator